MHHPSDSKRPTSVRTRMQKSFIILVILSLCHVPRGICQGDLSGRQVNASPGTYSRPYVYQTESGFMNIRTGASRRSSGMFESPLTDNFLIGDENENGEDEDLKFQSIWTDPDNFCNCWNTTDGSKVMEVECKCNGTMSQLIPILPQNVQRIVIKDGTNFTVLKNEDLIPYSESLKEISLTDLPQFSGIRNGTFTGMHNLDTIYIMEMPRLRNLSDGVFNVLLPKLKTIRISHSSLNVPPNLSRLSTFSHLDLVDLENNKIDHLVPGWVKSVQINYLSLSYNRVKEIGANVFSGSTISRLKLKGNRDLVTLHPEAFSGIQHLSELDLSETAITHLPIQGLQQIDKLRLENVFSLRVIPSIYYFDNLKEAWLTFPYHCCAFEFPEAHDPAEYAKHREFIKSLAEMGCDESNPDGDAREGAGNVVVPTKMQRTRRYATTYGDGNYPPYPHDEYDPFAFDDDKSFGHLPAGYEGNTPAQSFGDSRVDDFGTFHSNVIKGPPPTRIAHCGHVTQKKALTVKCQPLPDAFSPCEDIMGNAWLRAGVWVVVGLALIGNTAVLVVLILAPGRMSVQRFLMANLSWADLCMGIYLLMVATEDLVSLGAYFNYAIDWQLGWGCQLAGFFTVFASELSVFTLAIITGERWYALTRALHLTKRLTITKAAQLMSLGWICAIALAALPLLGVSSYSRTSICLPMEATTLEAQAYLVFLLLFNGVAFILVAYAYCEMYRAVAGHGNVGHSAPAAHSADAAIAKKMALLVFTDFACWAPVAFFGLTAVAGAPLIGVTDSKILLVFFYPLNACCNPYLYAILTKQYRRDLLLLLSRHGICTRRAARYKTGQTGSTNNTMHTMQTILRLGSVAEAKVTNGGPTRASIESTGGNTLQAGGSTYSAATAAGKVPTAPIPISPQGIGKKMSSIGSMPTSEKPFEEAQEGGIVLETSFMPLRDTSNSKPNGRQKHVKITTGSTPDEHEELFQNARRLSEFEQDVTESTPFCP